MKIIKICMLCGKNHKGLKPEICIIKGALVSAMMEVFNAEGMLMIDRTPLLKVFEKQLKKRGLISKKQKK